VFCKVSHSLIFWRLIVKEGTDLVMGVLCRAAHLILQDQLEGVKLPTLASRRIIAVTVDNTFLESGDVGFTAMIAGITINDQVPEFAAHILVWIFKYSSIVFTVALICEVSKSSGIDILEHNYFFIWLFRVSIVHES